VVDPLFKELYLKNRPLDHVLGAYEVTPEEHIKMQVAIQSQIDSAISKTCNLPKEFVFTSELATQLASYAKEVKGFTFYKAGSRGNEPLEALNWKELDLNSLIINGEVLPSSTNDCTTGACEI
jgi:ribonucleotide reductase alpha subunit